jgi:hypothetical protein
VQPKSNPAILMPANRVRPDPVAGGAEDVDVVLVVVVAPELGGLVEVVMLVAPGMHWA